jgi:amino acid adenylation domain-containing protein/non-ribosomal peptide synthase protein (TIGR01720 family)
VGVYVERSAEMVASLLAILKVGAAYVPLDPSYPHDRLRFIIEDAGISILLTQEQLLGKLAGDFQSIAIDRDQQKIRQCSEGNIEGQITAKHLAYIIYTSGSTGMPKGVQISHTAVVNFLSAMSSRPGISSMERLLAVTSLSFDIAGLELFLPLINRACLIIASRSLASAGEKLMQALERLDITMMQATPSTWRMLVEAGWTGKRNLKILCGGEALPQELAAQLLTRGVSLWNLYGPTETTIWSTCQHIQSTFTPVSIGAPIANTEIYVVDASLEPVPVGVPGELYIGGQGVADGYLNRPALTAERFLPHPFSAAPGARLYKTGDLVRWRADGSLDYLGRLDNQVKLRGYRIEPGEIEATLQRHPAVLQSVVIPSQDQPDHRHLVAYIVIAPHTAVSSQHITEHVQQWQNVWDEAYHVSVSLAGFAFNISGWNSSYTHQPIPLEQMREWVEQTVKHIRTLHPQRVLEIGCGTGLLLFQLEPDCQLYWGTDISANGLHYIQQVCIQQKKQIPPLLQRAADDFTGIERGAFDTVILNSVIQYFPSVEYLFTVIQKAVQVLSPEGKIFIGDVRSLPLLELFHTSVQLATAADSVSLEQLLQRIGQQQADEQELVLAPAFFQALLLRLPQIRRLQIQLKRGRLHSEMTRFRYDVVLYLQELPPSYEIQWRDWRADQANVASFKEQLLVRKTEALGIRGVPNARLQTEIRASRLLTEMEKTRTALDLRNELRAVEREVGIDPEAFWALEQAGTHTIIINWSGEDYGCYDVVCLPLLAGAKPKGEGQRAPGFRPEQEVYANYPLQRSENMALIAEMREYLRLHLPDYMLPAHFVVVDSLPLTPNGKLDRSRLPHPIIARTGMREKFVAPRSVTEETLFQIWRQVLNLEQIGTHDNFFHLGGDSLLVIRIVARANQEGIRITTKQVFLHPTIAALAAVAGSSRLVAEQAPIIGPLSFMPSQSWFLEMDHQHLNYYNIEFLLEAQEKLDPALIKTVIACLLLQHDSLRLRLALEKKKPQLILAAPDERVPLRRVNIADLSAMEQEAAIEALVSEVQCSLDLENGLLFQAIFLERGAQKPDAVLFAAHYLLADLLSWQILLADFALAYQQLQHEGEINLPAKTTSVKQWVERLIDHVPIVIQQEQAYWLAEPRKHVSSLPLDFPAGANTVASSRSVVLQFSKEDTRVLLHGFPRLAGAQIDAVLLTALTEAFTRWTGSSTFLVELLGHGREALFEDMDLSHTIGSLNIMFPVLLEKDAAVSVPEMLKTIQAQLQAIPYHGIGYGILRYLSRAESLVQQLRSLPQPEVYFNYVGIMPAPSTFQIARGFGGHHLDRDALRPRLLEITAISLSEGYIELEWEYSENIYKPATIKRLACYMRDALQALVVHCLPPGSPGEKLWGESAQLLSTGTPRSDI